MEEAIPEKLIVRYLSNEATSEEQIQLFEWISISIENQKIFNECCELWNKQYKAKEYFNGQQALYRVSKRIETSELGKKPSVNPWLRIAAAVTLLALVGFSIFYAGKFSEINADLAYTECTNPFGQKSVLTLSDGSTIHLNAVSTLRFPETFKGMRREVYLQGEAFFDIQKDSLRPFIIHTGEVHTQVLGTSFNIRTDENIIEVAVATGKVKVIEGEQVAFLTANEMLTVVDHTLTREPADMEKTLAWKNNLLVLENLTLADAALHLEKWYGVKIVIENKNIGACRISGRYKNQSLTNVLTAIAHATEIQFEIKNKEVKLFGKGCE